MLRPLLVLGLGTLGHWMYPHAQAVPTATVQGAVHDAARGNAVPSATVSLVAGARVVATVTTNDQGRFNFLNVAVPCTCLVRVSKSGFFDTVSGLDGRHGEGATATRLQLAADQELNDVVIRLTPHSVLGGRVLNAKGQPMVKVPVRLIRKASAFDREFLIGGAAVTTNDLGEYEFGDLPAADYIVHLVAGHRYYPGASSIFGAVPVSVEAGKTRHGVDFEVTTTPSFKITGVVQGPTDVFKDMVVRLVSAGTDGLIGAVSTTTVTAGGTFEFGVVAPGSYVIIAGHSAPGLEDRAALMTAPAMPRPLGAPSSFSSIQARTVAESATLRDWYSPASRPSYGRLEIVVDDRDLRDLRLPVGVLPSVSGTIEWEGDRPVETAAPGSIRLESIDLDPTLGLPQSKVAASGTARAFTISGARPGRYVLRTDGPHRIKSVFAGDRELGDVLQLDNADITGLRVVLAERMSEISGTVFSRSSDDPVIVLAFPADEAEWTRQGWSAARIRTSQPTPTNTFRLTDMPAGTYQLVAVQASDSWRWRDPSFLRKAGLFATRVTVGWGDAPSVQVRVVPEG